MKNLTIIFMAGVIIVLLLIGCEGRDNPPAPTPIPTITVTPPDFVTLPPHTTMRPEPTPSPNPEVTPEG